MADRPVADLMVSLKGAMHSVSANVFLESLAADLEVLSAINRSMSSGEFSIEIKVGAPEQGSLDFLIHIVGLGVAIPGLFGYDGYAHVKDIVSVFADILGLRNFLGGRAPASQVVNGSQVTLTNESGDIYYVDQRAFNIHYSDPTVDQALERKFSALSSDPHVTGISFSSADLPKVSFDKEDFGRLEQPVSQKEQVVPRVEELEADIFPVTFATEGGRAWLAYFNGDRKPFHLHNATMNGRRFYNVIKQDGMRFGVGDRMKVRMEITKVFDSRIGEFINRSFEVVEVLEYHSRPDQKDFGFS